MINFVDVIKRYRENVVLNNISLKFDENKIYCLLGRNGAGKTTLMKLIAGYINVTSGTIMVDGKKVSTMRMPDNVNLIENRGLQFNLSVEKLIKIAKELQDDFDSDFAFFMLEKFNLDKKKKYKQLSFGMQTMLTTLLSLASNSKVVLLDEPVLGFDAFMRDQFYELLKDSFEKHPRLIIVSTHLVDEIAKSAEEVIILDSGEILLQATINDIDEKAYSIMGATSEVKLAIRDLNVIGQKTIGGFTTVYIYDHRTNIPLNLTVQPVGLQEFFINIVGVNAYEN